MNFTELEKDLAGKLKEAGMKWSPQEGDWFWSPQDVSHQFYLGESIPASYSFRAGEAHVFDSGMTWHIQQGGLDPGRFVWLPTWRQCRDILKTRGEALSFSEENGTVRLEFGTPENKITASGATDLEAIYRLMLITLEKESRSPG